MMTYLFWYSGITIVIFIYLAFMKSVAIYRKLLHLPIKRLPSLWWSLDEGLSSSGVEWLGPIVFASLWPVHFLSVGIFIIWKLIIKRFALSKEERASMALGTNGKATNNDTQEVNW